MKKNIIALLFALLNLYGFSQDSKDIKWLNPAENSFSVIEGQGWAQEVEEAYDRFPFRAKENVAEDVWRLSKQSAGLIIRFRTNSDKIIVRYKLKNKGTFAFNHMPATGVSGVDLYAIDSDGKELWCAATRNFSDTATYKFQSINPNDKYHASGREYRLYLPLYNQVSWLEIGVDEKAYYDFLPVRIEKPIVVYGTSIAQGGCASRPGMAWTAILGRYLDRPLINLGFSGSGRLELPIIDLMTEIDAKIYILDCLPNLNASAWSHLGINSDQEFKDKVLNSVRRIKTTRPDVPILLVDHAGYTDEYISDAKKESFTIVNQLQQEAFYELRKEGYTKLYYLTKEEIGLHIDDMVDGVHPTDLGMKHYAISYNLKLRSILKEPSGISSTTQPVTQAREPHNYDWEKRHRQILHMNINEPPKTVILANSIIHFWGGLPRASIAREEDSWKDTFTPMGIRNYAYGWDRIENVLWRVYHGELDGFEAEKVFVMIGTNNLHLNTNDEIIEGLHLLIEAILIRQPKSEIVLMGLLPRRDHEQRIENLNNQIARLAGNLDIEYADLGSGFLDSEQKINESLFSDGLHPNEKGYLILREALEPLIIK